MAFDTTTDEVIDGVDLGGRVAVVTGATSGLGLETARALAAAGARVVLTARDAAKADGAVEQLRDRVPGAELETLVLDLTSLASVRSAAAELQERHPAVWLLVNNAGVMATPLERTTDGFELQLGTNHLGHFAFTTALLPALRAAAPARVVNLSSAGHLASDIRWDDPQFERTPYDKWLAYGQSKTANILFSVELDRRLAGEGVRANAVHPGMIATNLGRHLTADDRTALGERAKKSPVGKLPPYKQISNGAATSVWAAVAPELADVGGRYLEDCEISDRHAPYARDPESATRLWELSERLVGSG